MKSYHECPYCFKRFKHEAHFKKHECKEMKREKLLQSPVGQLAYEMHCDWKRARGMSKLSKIQFGESRAFVSMVKFAKFAKKVALPGRDKFIKYMAELGVHPKDWSSNMVYEHYLSKYDELFTPEEQADITIHTFRQLARIYECNEADIFKYMEPDTAAKLLQARKISPWVVLLSKKFLAFMSYDMTQEQRALVEVYVDPKVWTARLKKNPEFTRRMQKIVEGLGL